MVNNMCLDSLSIPQSNLIKKLISSQDKSSQLSPSGNI